MKTIVLSLAIVLASAGIHLLSSRTIVAFFMGFGWAGAMQHQGDLELITDVVKATADEIDWVSVTSTQNIELIFDDAEYLSFSYRLEKQQAFRKRSSLTRSRKWRIRPIRPLKKSKANCLGIFPRLFMHRFRKA